MDVLLCGEFDHGERELWEAALTEACPGRRWRTLDDARALIRLLKDLPAKVNLIPFNPWPGSAYECSDEARIQRFADIVNRAGYVSTVRTPRGRDILAACGQLKSESVRQRRARA